MRALLRSSDLRSFGATEPDKDKHPGPVPAIALPGTASFRVGVRGADLAQLLPELLPEHLHDIPTNGHWSLHEMLAYLLRITGPAQVWLTTWGISVKPMQAVMDMVRAKHIQHLHLLLNHRVRLQCPKAFQLLFPMAKEPNVRIALTAVHAKLAVLRNERWSITVITSANLTQNPRIEFYSIRTHKALADQHIAWLDPVIAAATPFHTK